MSVQQYKRCYHSHPPLPIGAYKIYGGSCIEPAVTDADIYVGFDLSMARSHMSYPWEQGESFLFYIQDMGVPKDPEQFKRLIDWIAEQLIAQKKVHLGCIGGHGRTGTVLSALVKVMTGETDAVQYVRKHYCEKAVESESQVKFLMQHFGVSKVQGYKEVSKRESSFHGNYQGSYRGNDSHLKSPSASSHLKAPAGSRPARIWGSTVTIDKHPQSDIITI